MSFVFLAAAILSEVGGTLSLRMATYHGRRWIPLVLLGYVTAFAMLSLSLSAGMTVGVAYGIWAAAGVALTAVAGRVLWKEPFTWVMGLGIVLLAGGVLLVELGAVQ